MVILLDERPAISAGDTEVVAVNYTSHLNSGEILVGTPTVVDQATTPSVLTIDDIAINSATYVESETGDTVAIGRAVLFSVTTTTSGDYTIRITVSTDSVPKARRFIRDISLRFV